jgi:hypothetical protein
MPCLVCDLQLPLQAQVLKLKLSSLHVWRLATVGKQTICACCLVKAQTLRLGVARSVAQ